MLKYILKRLVMLIPVIMVTSFLIFWAMSLTGGDPALMLAGDNAKPEQIEQIREELGLNDPFIVRYGNYMKGMITGDMGQSYVTKRDVFKTFMERLPNTLMLGGAAVLIAVVVSLPLGIYTAIHQNTWKDTAGMIFALFGNRRKGRVRQPGAAGGDRGIWLGGADYQDDPFLYAGCAAPGLYDHCPGKGLFREAGDHGSRIEKCFDSHYHGYRTADVSGNYRLCAGGNRVFLAGYRALGV